MSRPSPSKKPSYLQPDAPNGRPNLSPTQKKRTIVHSPAWLHIRRGTRPADIVQLCTSFQPCSKTAPCSHKTRNQEPGTICQKATPFAAPFFGSNSHRTNRLSNFFSARVTPAFAARLCLLLHPQNFVVHRPTATPASADASPSTPEKACSPSPVQRGTGVRAGSRKLAEIAYNPNHPTSIRGRWELKRGNPSENFPTLA